MTTKQLKRHVPAGLVELTQINQWVAYSATKIPISPNGVEASSTNRETWGTLTEAKFIREVQGLPGVGFVFAESDPYVGIDLDNAIDPATNELKLWALEIVESLNSYTELSPSGLGVHVIVRGETPRRGARRDLNDGKLECYSSARYFTVTGKHIAGTNEAIEHRDMMAFFERWFPTAQAATENHAPITMPPIWETAEVESWLSDALDHIPAKDYHDWIKVGMALKKELGEGGFGAWDRWSRSSEKYDARAVAAKWAGLPADSSVTIASVVWLAEQNGFEMPRTAPYQPLNVDWDAWVNSQLSIDGMASEGAEGGGLGLRFFKFTGAYRNREPYEPNLIEPGILSGGDILLLFGPPKSMKSMAIMDAFRSWCCGKPWLGLTPSRPLKAIYMQFEVKEDQMRRRIHLSDLAEDELIEIEDRLFITDRFTPILNADFVLQFAEATMKEIGSDVDVLIVDPIANIYTGDSENDNAQMSRFIRQIKVLRNAVNKDMAIILVHHANKSGKEDRQKEPFNSARGGSALRGAYDTGIYIDLCGSEDDENRPLKLWFELRNGPRMAPKTVVFTDGRFAEVADAPGAPDRTMTRERAGIGEDELEHDEFARFIEGTIVAEAEGGRYYTATTFAQTFHGFGPGNASESSIKRELSRLAVIGRVAFFTHAACLPLHHRAKGGYLCCRSMVLSIVDLDEFGRPLPARVFEITPTMAKHPASSDYCEVSCWTDVVDLVRKHSLLAD